MNQRNNTSGWLHGAILYFSVFVAILFSILWLREKNHKPTEVIREIEKPVELVKEVQVEAELTKEQFTAISLGNALLRTQTIDTQDEWLREINPLRINVNINKNISDILSSSRIKDKAELLLRNNNVPINDKSYNSAVIEINGIWDEDKITYSYTFSLKVYELVCTNRNGNFIGGRVSVWKFDTVGYAGNKRLKEVLLDLIDESVEKLANDYQKAN